MGRHAFFSDQFFFDSIKPSFIGYGLFLVEEKPLMLQHIHFPQSLQQS